MCRIDDCDLSEVSRSKTIKRSRVLHRCGECSRTIAVGESYHYCFMVMEGEPMTFRVCVHCQVATQWLTENCGGYVYDQVREEIDEHATEYPDLARPLHQLSAGMRAKWKGLPIPTPPPPITVAA